MKRSFLKSFALILALVMALCMLAACNTAPEKAAEEQIEEEAVEETAPSAKVTIQADGKELIIVDAKGKTVSDLLKDAGVTLGEGDVVSVDPDQVFGGDMTVKVLRKCAVTVTVEGDKNDENAVDQQYTAVLVGGTVADALNAVGVKLADNQEVTPAEDKELEDGMKIVVSVKEEEVVEEPAEETQETETAEGASDNNNNNSNKNNNNNNSNNNNSGSSGSGNSGSGSSGSGSSGSGNSGSGNSGSGNSGSGNSGSGNSGSSGKTVVSVDTYEDCDGSGHGVKVITYSDGSQEEVPF